MPSQSAGHALGFLLVFLACVVRGADAIPATSAPATLPRVEQRGSFIHDPSTITRCGNQFWIFSTGPGISSWHSSDLVKWVPGTRVFTLPPAWTTNIVARFRGYFWAPDVIQVSNRYLLYYSVSSWGKNSSAIGLATNATLDPDDSAFSWKDAGLVIRSRSDDPFNAIDPSVLRSADGKMWLAFGSFWSGIKLVQLDPLTGQRFEPDSPIYSLAWNQSIEAPCLYQQGDYYYLFVDWGLCCRGTNSTYNIRVGRSASVTGPYLDRQGRDLLQGGGTLFLGSEGKFAGPGHVGIYRVGETNWLSFHYYDRERAGIATLAIRPVIWAEGWPQFGKSERAN